MKTILVSCDKCSAELGRVDDDSIAKTAEMIILGKRIHGVGQTFQLCDKCYDEVHNALVPLEAQIRELFNWK